MNEQLRKLYLMTTRNSDFITQRNINKYLPLKNDLVNYDSILELNKSLAQVQMSFKVQQKNNKSQVKCTGSNQKINKYNKTSRKPRSQSNFVGPSLLEVYKSSSINKKTKNNTNLSSRIKNSYITIIENDPDPQIDTNNQLSRPLQKKTKQINNKSKNKELKPFQIAETDLDGYIQQYLKQLMEKQNVNIRQQIESDRRLFIQKAIRGLKTIIKHQKSHDGISDLQISYRKQNSKDSVEEFPYQINSQKGQAKQNLTNRRDKSKIKSNSTQLISADKLTTKTKNPEKTLPSIKSNIISTERALPHRSIYNSTPAGSFITKIGKTFYMNQLNTLNKTLQLEAKNRQRAQRFFRRKLINIQKQYEKISGNQIDDK